MADEKNVNEKTSDYIESGYRVVKNVAEDLFSLNSVQDLDLFRIGKPTGFHKSADPDSRIKYYMESKMNVIDIIPCAYKLPLSKAIDTYNETGKLVALEALTPSISYELPVKEYQNVCKVYGLDSKYGGLRLYITDETTSTDQFDVAYSDNMIEGAINAMSDKGRQFKNLLRSVSSQADQTLKNIGQVGGATGGKIAGSLLEFLTPGDTGLTDSISKLGSAIGTAVALGQKFSLPKIWADSNYSPNMNAVVKLVSPYGHPDAIKEFIIQPLMYLLIMATSRTLDGISYGAAPKVTIKAYGVAHYPLAGITGITINRGGADTSFNIYRQPLSVNVSLSFQPLVNGFAAYEEAGHEASATNYNNCNEVTSDLSSGQAGKRALFPTLGSYIDSLRPIAINQIVTKHNVTGLGTHLENKKDTKFEPYEEGTQSSMDSTSRQNASQQATDSAKGQTEHNQPEYGSTTTRTRTVTINGVTKTYTEKVIIKSAKNAQELSIN